MSDPDRIGEICRFLEAGELSLSDNWVELVNLETVARCVEDLRGLLEESELTERKVFIKSFVREVKAIDNEVLLTYTMPILPGNISEDRTGVLYSIHHGGVEVTIGRTVKDFKLTFYVSSNRINVYQ